MERPLVRVRDGLLKMDLRRLFEISCEREGGVGMCLTPCQVSELPRGGVGTIAFRAPRQVLAEVSVRQSRIVCGNMAACEGEETYPDPYPYLRPLVLARMSVWEELSHNLHHVNH